LKDEFINGIIYEMMNLFPVQDFSISHGGCIKDQIPFQNELQ